MAIEGFYEARREPTTVELDLIKNLAARFDAKGFLTEMDVTRFKQDNLEEALKAHCFQSELNLSGIKAGVVIEGWHKVMLSREAVASMDLRPVDGMSIEITLTIRGHLDRHGFSDIKLEVASAYLGGGTPVGH